MRTRIAHRYMFTSSKFDERNREWCSSSTGIKAQCAIKRAMTPNARRSDVEPGPIGNDLPL